MLVFGVDCVGDVLVVVGILGCVACCVVDGDADGDVFG